MHDTSPSPIDALRQFLSEGGFSRRGAVVTDLDGTAVIEHEGRIVLPPPVELGLQRIHAHGRPVVINTLRFPLSVIRVFGDEWHRATGAELPLVSLKGAQTGRVVRGADGTATFEEWHSETLSATEIQEVMTGVEGMVDDGVNDLLVFFYPRDWRRGERIWTPDAARIGPVRDKYRSASAVVGSTMHELRDALLAEPVCMIFLLIDLPEDRLMAYQHTRRTSFFTHQGVNKRSGAERIAERLGVDLAESIGAGDASTDDFLEATGFSIIVGNNDVDYQGRRYTARVEGIADFGALLAAIDESLP